MTHSIFLWHLAAIAAVTTLPAAGATHWVPVITAQAPVRFYVDQSSVRTHGKVYRAQLLYDFTDPQFNEEFGTYSRSYVVESYVDCAGRRLAVARMRLYSENKGRGKLLGATLAGPALRWTDTHAGTINGAIVETACMGQSFKKPSQ